MNQAMTPLHALRVLPLVFALLLAGCASVSEAPPQSESTTYRFEKPADLDAWIANGGEWSVEDGQAIGRSLHPASNRYSWLTCRQAYGDIERVVVRAGLDQGSTHNLRLGVGAMTVILNWEVSDANLVHYIGSDARGAGPRALTPGQESEIVVESVGTGGERHLRLVVDDRVLWEETGPPLMGTVTVYPAWGSTIRVRDVRITGKPAPCIEVHAPSLPHF